MIVKIYRNFDLMCQNLMISYESLMNRSLTLMFRRIVRTRLPNLRALKAQMPTYFLVDWWSSHSHLPPWKIPNLWIYRIHLALQKSYFHVTVTVNNQIAFCTISNLMRRYHFCLHYFTLRWSLVLRKVDFLFDII